MEIEKNLEVLNACRYCPMCRHVCTSGLLSNLESDFPRGRGLILYHIYKGVEEYSPDLVNSIYNCILCGCCWSNCEGGYMMPELVKSAREDIVHLGKQPEAAKEIKDSLIEKDNPYGMDRQNSFSASMEEKKSDILYYMGPEVNYKNHEIARAAIKIFSRLKINYTILKDEPSSGKIMALLGYTADAKRKAKQVYDRIMKIRCRDIIVSDPLAYDAFKNDYKGWGFNFEGRVRVLHVSEYLALLLKEGDLKLEKIKKKVTLVDSEYLGRFNMIFEQPRDLIKASAYANFTEMRCSRERLLATGEAAFVFKGRKFSEGKKLGEKICSMAQDIGAEEIVTLSPTAKYNLKNCPDSKVLDIAEFVAELI